MKSAIVFLLGGSLLAWTMAHAQSQNTQIVAEPVESMTAVALKGKAPVNQQILSVTLPIPQQATLSNGLRIFLLEDHKLPVFSLQFSIRGGGLADPPQQQGLAMITAGMLREGTKRYGSREIAEKFATLGASFDATATPSSMESAISVTGLSENIDAIIALVGEVVRHPEFSSEELEKFKTRHLSTLQYQRSLPSFLAREAFMAAVYGAHPGSLVVPPESVLRSVTRSDLVAYHDAMYWPDNIILVAHGDLTIKELVAALENTFGSWSKTKKPMRPPPLAPQPSKSRVMLLDRPGSVQTSLWLGALGIRRDSEDYFPLLVMNHILGGGPASRLFLNLREDKGYTYGVSSIFTGSNFPGVVVVVTDVRTDVTGAAMQELLFELRRIASEPVSAQELRNAKRAIIGSFALSLDTPYTLIANVLTQKVLGLPENYWETYPQRVAAVTPDDIERVAAKYYGAEGLQIVAVGDGVVLRDILAKYGDVQITSGGGLEEAGLPAEQ